MPFVERANIVSNLKVVDEVIDFDDDAKGSSILALEKIKKQYPADEIIFCNGGDRKEANIPEMGVDGVTFKFSVGGDMKINSSSEILKNWNYDSEERVWGKFYNLFSDGQLKLKELILEPGKGMSFQRHFKRNEIWFISKGSCEINFSESSPENATLIRLKTEDVFHVRIGAWHQIINPTEEPCHIIEIQYGEETDEEDIERLSFYKSN